MSALAPKPAAEAAAADPFAAAKANIRDTIKWLTTTFSAIAGVILAGSTLAGLGALPFGWRLGVAAFGALLGFACTMAAIARVLGMLKSEAFFLGEIEKNKKLRDWVDAHAEDLLPAEYGTAQEFLDARRAARAELKKLSSQASPDPAAYEKAVARFKAFGQASAPITSLLHFERMAERLGEESRPLMVLASLALLGLGVFAWAAGAPKPAAKPEPAPCSCCVPCRTEPAPAKTSILVPRGAFLFQPSVSIQTTSIVPG